MSYLLHIPQLYGCQGIVHQEADADSPPGRWPSGHCPAFYEGHKDEGRWGSKVESIGRTQVYWLRCRQYNMATDTESSWATANGNSESTFRVQTGYTMKVPASGRSTGVPGDLEV